VRRARLKPENLRHMSSFVRGAMDRLLAVRPNRRGGVVAPFIERLHAQGWRVPRGCWAYRR
jgi:hypothetical protein